MTKEANTLNGGCLCGNVRYQIHGDPLFVSQCFCRDCQLATGTGHTTIVGVHCDNLTVEGTPTVYSSQGETGGAVHRHFCGACGSRLYTSGDLPGPVRMIQAGSLNDPNAVSPTAAIYLKDRIHWDMVADDIDQHMDLGPAPV